MTDLFVWLTLFATMVSSVVAAVRSVQTKTELVTVKLSLNTRLDQLISAERRIAALEVEVTLLRRLTGPDLKPAVEVEKAPSTGS